MIPGRWAACLSRTDASAAARLRRVTGIEICPQPGEIWLRGQALDEALLQQLRALPGARRYTVLPDGQLLAPQARLPRGRLPDGPWQPLEKWMEVTLPAAGLAGRLEHRVPLRLERSAGGVPTEAEPNLLLTESRLWSRYAITAARVRLDRWAFAVASDGRVAVRGRPLPPLPGERCVEQEGIAVPCGWSWSPPVDAAIVRELFALQSGDVALWTAEGGWQRIAGADFVRASRSAARAILAADGDRGA